MEVVLGKDSYQLSVGFTPNRLLALLLARMEQEVLLTPLVQVNNPLMTVLLVEQLAVWKL